MTPEVATWTRVLSLSAVTAIAATRVWRKKAEQQTALPHVVISLVHEPTFYHLRGGLRDRARVQTDAYAAEGSGLNAADTADALADAIHGDDGGSGLSGWRGFIGSPPFWVTGILRIERDGPFFEGGERRLWRVRQDYWVYFRMQ